MTRKIIFFAMAMALAGCGKKDVLDVAPEFQEYVTRFEQVSADYGSPVTVSNLSIHFGKMQSRNENGACEIIGDKTPTITINEQVWDVMDDLEREALMFHEMGHCVLNLNHVKDANVPKNVNTSVQQLPAPVPYGAPISLMNPYRLDSELYADFVDYYHKDLFGRKPNF
jgi:hypothetical protein